MDGRSSGGLRIVSQDDARGRVVDGGWAPQRVMPFPRVRLTGDEEVVRLSYPLG